VQNVTGIFQIDMKGGIDRVSIGNATIGQLQVPGGMTINTGGGNDSVTLVDVQTSGPVNFNTWDGSDVVTVRQSVLGDTKVDTNLGDDRFWLADQSQLASLNAPLGGGADKIGLVKSFIAGLASIDTSSGADVVILHGLESNGTVKITTGTEDDRVFIGVDPTHMGQTWTSLGVPAWVAKDATSGLNTLGSLNVNGGTGADKVGFEKSTVAVDAVFSLAAGDDWLGCQSNQINGNFLAYMADGADYAGFRSNQVQGRVLIDAGGWNDKVEAQSNTIQGSLTVNLQAGTDRLNAQTNHVTGYGYLYGGPGYDTLADGGGNTFGNPGGNPVVSGFEKFL
jgi:hypothetical protein